MARTRTISDDQILEAARELFLDRGMSVTTAEIAAHAGVSEGTIFRRFPTKEELFQHALGLPESPAWFDKLEVGPEVDLRAHLEELGLEVVTFFRTMIPRMMMTRSCGMDQLQVFGRVEGLPVPAWSLKKMTAMLTRAVERGQIQTEAPQMVARTFIGALAHFAVTEFVGVNAYMPIEPESYVRGVVATLWDGIAPESPAGGGSQ